MSDGIEVTPTGSIPFQHQIGRVIIWAGAEHGIAGAFEALRRKELAGGAECHQAFQRKEKKGAGGPE